MNNTELLARAFVTVLTDPTLPMNQLKRPAKRTCWVCGGKYVSRVSVLCGDGLCSDACRENAQRTNADMQRRIDDMRNRLAPTNVD